MSIVKEIANQTKARQTKHTGGWEAGPTHRRLHLQYQRLVGYPVGSTPHVYVKCKNKKPKQKKGWSPNTEVGDWPNSSSSAAASPISIILGLGLGGLCCFISIVKEIPNQSKEKFGNQTNRWEAGQHTSSPISDIVTWVPGFKTLHVRGKPIQMCGHHMSSKPWPQTEKYENKFGGVIFFLSLYIKMTWKKFGNKKSLFLPQNLIVLNPQKNLTITYL